MKRAFTLVETLITITVIAVLTVVVLAFVSNYTTWAKKSRDERTIALLNDAVNRYKAISTNDSILYGTSSYLANSTTHNKIVINALKDGFIQSGQDHKFLAKSDVDIYSINSSGEGQNFLFTAYYTADTIYLTANALAGQEFTKLIDFIPSALPSWLSLVGNQLVGTPTSEQSEVINGTVGTKKYRLTITVVGGLPVITSNDYINVVTNVPSNYSIMATNATSYALNGPAWAALNGPQVHLMAASSGASYDVTMTVAAINQFGTTTKDVTIHVTQGPPVFTSANNLTAYINNFFTHNVIVDGTVTASTSFNFNSETATLSGIPQTSGTYPITFSATNGAGTTTQNFLLTVEAAPIPVYQIIP